MPPTEEDWSDSDGEEAETSVLLGIPDGQIEADSDLDDAAVSRIGGHPAFLPALEPPFSSSDCKICYNPMELLVQIWCPFEDSPMDRALYMWGCPRAGCQGKQGSVRAWRGLRYNQKYATKLERKLAQKRERQKAKAEALAHVTRNKTAAKINPFSMKGTSAPNPFGIGHHLFGELSPPMDTVDNDNDVDNAADDESDTESDTNSSEKSLLTAMASASIADSLWKSAPTYPPFYLSTVSEYLPPQSKPRLPPGVEVADPDDIGVKDMSWASETYENSLDVDQAFERFTKRVSYEPEQCVRYELKGTPLPFSSDAVFKSLFPAPTSPPLPVTRPDFKVVHPQKRVYNPSSIPNCSFCKSPRTFECQLMPNLINILRPKESEAKKLTDEERRKAVEQTLKGNDKNEKRGMEWGTCMIFSCEKDCCIDVEGQEASDGWKEEVVLIQLDV